MHKLHNFLPQSHSFLLFRTLQRFYLFDPFAQNHRQPRASPLAAHPTTTHRQQSRHHQRHRTHVTRCPAAASCLQPPSVSLPARPSRHSRMRRRSVCRQSTAMSYQDQAPEQLQALLSQVLQQLFHHFFVMHSPCFFSAAQPGCFDSHKRGND